MEEKIAEILGALQTAVTTLAPDAWFALIVAARIDSILSLAYSLTVLAVVIAWLKTRRPFFAWIETLDDGEPQLMAWIAGTFVLSTLTIVAVVVLFSTSTWLGLFYPEAAVVRDLLTKAAG